MWKLSKSLKLLIGIATFWPLPYLIIFIFGELFLAQVGHQEPAFLANFMPLILVFHFATLIGGLVLWVFYIIDIMKNPRVSQEHRVYWAVGIFLSSMLVMPAYWYFNIWRDIPDHPDNIKSPPQKI